MPNVIEIMSNENTINDRPAKMGNNGNRRKGSVEEGIGMLRSQPMYGYEMTKKIEVLTNGSLTFKEGTLYPILHHFEMVGYVQSSWSNENGGRRRKYYAITDEGSQHLTQKRREWTAFRQAVSKVIIGEAPV